MHVQLLWSPTLWWARGKLTLERNAGKALYNEERAAARLALFEQQSLLMHDTSELGGYEDGTLFPKMDALQQSISGRRREIDRLTPIVGDPSPSSTKTVGCQQNVARRCSSTIGSTASGGSASSGPESPS
ncbi:hypothetical protein BH09ACT8_BH09ACT8_15640 [soil metagenome]